MPRREGQLLAEDFFNNVGGLNTAQSPFVIPPTQSAGGKNYDYTSQGVIRKRRGHTKANTGADTSNPRSLGINVWNPSTSDTRKIIRCGSTRLQTYDPDLETFTNLTEDTASAGSTFFDSGTTIPVVSTQFNTSDANILWHVGGGSSYLYGVYSATKATANGVAAPTASSFTATAAAGGSLTAGTYRYTLVYRKSSTQALSNGTLEASATTSGGNLTINLAWTLSNLDTTKYDKIYVYRSASGGAASFTTGDLIAQLASSATSYSDTGSSITSSTNVPRAGGTVDNSILPSTLDPVGVASWKRRLVTAFGSVVYISDLNKPESWPTVNTITIPSGGKITGFGVISFTSRGSNTIDELLVVFKQNECWVITGSSVSDWALKFVDNVGCPAQQLIAAANGYVFWCSSRGFHLWNGTEKPGYLSQFIEDQFQENGQIDKSLLNIGYCVYSQKRNEVAWYLTTSQDGENKAVFKLNLRLTLGAMDQSIGLAVVPGVFTPDSLFPSMYAGNAFYLASDSSEETYLIGDAGGYLYEAYSGLVDGSNGLVFEYETPFLSFGAPGSDHQFHKVIAWVLDTGAWDLTLDYWTKFKFIDTDATSISVDITEGTGINAGIWDTSLWDHGLWDGFTGKIVPVVFNLGQGTKNANQGDAIKLRFSQTDTGTTGNQVYLYGFTVYYTDLPLRK